MRPTKQTGVSISDYSPRTFKEVRERINT